MNIENLKSKITKKHLIIGASALVLIGGGTAIAVTANSNNSDTEPVKTAEVSTEATTEVVTTTKATTTAVTTTTTTTTTTKVTTTEKKKDKPKKTEAAKQEEYYEEPAYEEPVYEEPVKETPVEEPAVKEEPKVEEPVYEEPAFPLIDGLTEDQSRMCYENGYSAHSIELYKYGLSMGLTDSQARTYVRAVNINATGEEIVICDPGFEGSYYGVWRYNPETGIYTSC